MLHRFFLKFKANMIAVCSRVSKCCSSVVLQLQVDAVMKHAMKIVETEKFSGIRVGCFSLLDLGAFLLKFGSLHLSVNNRFPTQGHEHKVFLFSYSLPFFM